MALGSWLLLDASGAHDFTSRAFGRTIPTFHDLKQLTWRSLVIVAPGHIRTVIGTKQMFCARRYIVVNTANTRATGAVSSAYSSASPLESPTSSLSPSSSFGASSPCKLMLQATRFLLSPLGSSLTYSQSLHVPHNLRRNPPPPPHLSNLLKVRLLHARHQYEPCSRRFLRYYGCHTLVELDCC